MKRRDDLAFVLAGAIVLLSVNTSCLADGLSLAKDGNLAGAPACSSCHGAQGEGGPDSSYPRLAGMSAAYLLRQLNSFADGSRDNDIMPSVARSLTSDERRAVADYYASQQAPRDADANPPEADLVARGKAIATVGLWDKGLPACGACHGSRGQVVGEAFPRLSGQSATYIEDQLAQFGNGKRHNDPMHLMGGIAGKLTENDAKAVAAYYANSRDPSGRKDQQ
jgi:cytochrome c553